MLAPRARSGCGRGLVLGRWPRADPHAVGRQPARRGAPKHLGKGSAKDAIKKGHISFELHGEKLKGAYSLRRIREGDKPQWLLVKKKDDEADSRGNPVVTQPKSVLSGKTIEEIAAEEE